MSLKCLNKNQCSKIYKSQKKQRNIVKNDTVVNISNKKLTLCESNILNKGLHFCISETNRDKIAVKMKKEIKHFVHNLPTK